MDNHHLVVLGADDPEMSAIERIVKAAGYRVAYATWGGVRVSPSEAYQADAVRVDPEILGVVLVECRPEHMDVVNNALLHPGSIQITTIDHHRPGDPGYGRPPAEYLAASSIGQVLDYLAKWGLDPLPNAPHVRMGEPDAKLGLASRGWPYDLIVAGSDGNRYAINIPQELRLTAAADHCLAAAYRGECPGVDPEHLMAWRVESRAAFQRRAVEEVLADVELARSELRRRIDTDSRTIAGVRVAVFAHTIPELPEAAAREGIPFLADLVERGQRKIVLQAAPPEVVVAWMEEQRRFGLSPYGDPARGFAGVQY